MSILAGMGELVDRWLGVEPVGRSPHYRHKSAAHSFKSTGLATQETFSFFRAGLSRIQENWSAARDVGLSSPSRQNWRWKRHPTLSTQNPSPEIILERRIVSACGNSWSNQMPTASGLVGPTADKRGAVDLVNRISAFEYSLIELKVGSDNPLFAAIEILLYGLLFAWSRRNLKVLGYDPDDQPVLVANRINLAVLAPHEYYAGYFLGDFGESLNRNLHLFHDESGVKMGFGFYEFGVDPDIQFYDGNIRRSVDSIQPAMDS